MKVVKKSGLRRGFTLIELTVVILIIGIVATIAAPKFFQSVDKTKESSAKQTIEVVRNAVELFRSNTTTYLYPGQAGDQAAMKLELKPYLRKDFPELQVGKLNANIKFVTADPVVATADPEAWVYNKTTGEIRINQAEYITY